MFEGYCRHKMVQIQAAIFSSYLNPDKHKTQTPYVHLFTFLQHVSVVLFNNHQGEITST